MVKRKQSDCDAKGHLFFGKLRLGDLSKCVRCGQEAIVEGFGGKTLYLAPGLSIPPSASE